MIVLDAISTKLNPNAIATQVAKSVIVCSRSICIFPLTHAYITYYRFGPGISGNTDAVRKIVDGALFIRDMTNA